MFSTTVDSHMASGSTLPRRTGDTIRQVLVVVALVSTIVVNALANIVPFNGITTGQLSDKYPVYIVPAGYVFSIWSVIYLGLAAYALYQAQRGSATNPRLRAIGGPFLLSSVANIAWIFLWHYEFVLLSVAVMVVLLMTLIYIYQQLYAHFGDATLAERWTTHIPFRIYLGWITVATIANVTTLLYDVGWSGWGIAPTAWSVIMQGVATLIGLVFILGRRDIAYGAVLIWAFVGIYVKFGDAPLVANSALTFSIGLALAALWIFLNSLRQPQAARNG